MYKYVQWTLVAVSGIQIQERKILTRKCCRLFRQIFHKRHDIPMEEGESNNIPKRFRRRLLSFAKVCGVVFHRTRTNYHLLWWRGPLQCPAADNVIAWTQKLFAGTLSSIHFVRFDVMGQFRCYTGGGTRSNGKQLKQSEYVMLSNCVIIIFDKPKVLLVTTLLTLVTMFITARNNSPDALEMKCIEVIRIGKIELEFFFIYLFQLTKNNCCRAICCWIYWKKT